MPTYTHSLEPITLSPGTTIRQPPRGALETVTPDSPALSVMTDLKRSRAITIAPGTSIATALTVMIHANVRLLLVLDEGGCICGVVSSRDLSGEKPLRIAAADRIPHEAVKVEQVMSGIADMRPLDLGAVRHASVRDIVRHLMEENRQHALVVEARGEGEYVARGIFSATQIGRQLGREIALGEGPAQSFAELERLIA